MKRIIPILLGAVVSGAASLAAATPPKISDQCEKDLLSFPGPVTPSLVKQSCAKVVQDAECTSVEGVPIYHYEKLSSETKAKRVLVVSLIHGDEKPAGSVGRYWMERLEGIDPRNSWRVVPVLNPDGLKLKTRTNANRIDLNRNFPTKDWDELAVKLWKSQLKSNPRRFPGKEAGSEPEVRCALKHIEDFKPDFIVSIHTPLKVLDFDGPHVMKPPKFDYLPWKSLGHYPGSLGRYMWFERNTPVLTTELEDRLPRDYKPFEKLQDIIGTLVQIEAEGPRAGGPVSVPSVAPTPKPASVSGEPADQRNGL